MVFGFQLFAIIVFGCISSQGWSYNNKLGRDVCVMNEQSSACHFPTFVGVMAFIVSLGLIVGEWWEWRGSFFTSFSSNPWWQVLWAILLYQDQKALRLGWPGLLWPLGLFLFRRLSLDVCGLVQDRARVQELRQFHHLRRHLLLPLLHRHLGKYPEDRVNGVQSTLWLFCPFFQGGGAYFAYQRYKAGADTAFTSGIGDDELGNDYAGGSGGYVGDGDDMQYSEPPFSGGSNNGKHWLTPGQSELLNQVSTLLRYGPRTILMKKKRYSKHEFQYILVDWCKYTTNNKKASWQALLASSRDVIQHLVSQSILSTFRHELPTAPILVDDLHVLPSSFTSLSFVFHQWHSCVAPDRVKVMRVKVSLTSSYIHQERSSNKKLWEMRIYQDQHVLSIGIVIQKCVS